MKVYEVKTAAIPPTGTGSFQFDIQGQPYVGLQLIKLEGVNQTTEFVNVYWTCVKNKDIPGASQGTYGGFAAPSSSVALGPNVYDIGQDGTWPSYYWTQDTSFSGTLFTGSSPASVMHNLGNVGAVGLRVDVGSKTGGRITVAIGGKGS